MNLGRARGVHALRGERIGFEETHRTRLVRRVGDLCDHITTVEAHSIVVDNVHITRIERIYRVAYNDTSGPDYKPGCKHRLASFV